MDDPEPFRMRVDDEFPAWFEEILPRCRAAMNPYCRPDIAPASARPRRRRKPSKPRLATQVARAEKAVGKPVTSITTPDGTTIRFDEPSGDSAADTTDANPWDEVWIDAANQKRPS
jgi:hypothetical protein